MIVVSTNRKNKRRKRGIVVLKTLRKLTFRTLVVLNVVAVIALLIVGYSGRINPVDHPIIATLGLGFPFVLIANIAFIVLWVFIRKRMLWLPIFGLIISYGPIRNYCPFNLSKEKPHGAIKVLSYNVYLFDTWDDVEGKLNPIADYIIRSKADIVCLQEAKIETAKKPNIMHTLRKHYKYIDRMVKRNSGDDHMVLLSKFPILSRDSIPYSSHSNMSVAYMLDVNGTKTLLVNNHFESYGLTEDEKTSFTEMVDGKVAVKKAKGKSVSLIDKLGKTMMRRAPQVDAVAAYVKKYLDKGTPVILCGDFNDTPISYSHDVINGLLTDSYASSGNGLGFSYNKSKMYFRIDHIFASSEFEPYGAKVDKSINNSDHYPISCWLKYRPKP